MNPKFLLKKDMVINPVLGSKLSIKLFDAGTIFEPNEEGKYTIESHGSKSILDVDGMRKSVGSDNEYLFEEVKEEQKLDIIIEEIPDDDDEQIKRWRIQLDVTTTRKKLKEIEAIVNDTIKKLL